MKDSIPQSLRRTLLRILILASLAALLSVALCVFFYETVTLKQRMIQESQKVLLLLDKSLLTTLAFDDPITAQRFLEILRGNTDITAVGVYDEEHRLFQSYVREGVRFPLPETAAPAAPAIDQGQLRLWHPMHQHQQHLGDILLVSQVPGLADRLPQYAFMFGGILLALCIVGLTLHRGLSLAILSPISRLLALTNEVSRSGDFSLRADVHSGSEIGRLADAFNEMLAINGAREAELRHSNAQINSIINSATEIIIAATDTEGILTLFSIGAERKLGYNAQELIGRQTPLLWHLASEIEERAADLAKRTGRQLGGFDFFKVIAESPGLQLREWTLVRNDGGQIKVHLVVSAIRDTQGNVSGYLGVGTDVTNLIQLEESLRQAQKMEAVGQLAGGIAHDFNNILAAMLLNLGLLQENALDDETMEGLRELEREANRAAGLTRQLLVFSRRSMMQMNRVDLVHCINGMAKMLRRIIGEHIQLQLSLPGRVVVVQADAGMIEQVLVNLCVNARDAMPRGGQLGITLDTVELGQPDMNSHPSARPGPFARLCVSDTGCGMDAATLGRIFEPFFTTKEVGKGTGLGLATVHGIVRQHNGWMEVTSAVNQGSRFTFFLPMLLDQEAPTSTEPDNTPLPQGRGTVLLVEDDRSVRSVTALFLRKRGYEILEAGTGREALRVWADRHDDIELLYTDMVMPDGMSGAELAAQLRGERPGLRVILTSGYSSVLQQQEQRAMKDIVFLQKPCEIRIIAQTVLEVLSRPGPGGAGADDTEAGRS